MNEDCKLLLEITNEIADSDAPLKSFGQSLMELGLMLRRLVDETRGLDQFKGGMAPSITQSGAALDPWHASMCLEDQGRSAAFIRGTVRAAEDWFRQNPGRILRWTEAGCGPLAMLSLPVMARFGADQIQVQLIDLHQESLDAAQHLIERLGLSDRLSGVICGDLEAIPLEDDQDIVALETMAAALGQEPQVALTQILTRRLPSAALLPQSISVDLQLLDAAEEHRQIPPAVKERQRLGTVFELTPESVRDIDFGNSPIVSRLRLPEQIEPGQGLALTTTVEVYRGVTIADYDAAITLPVPLPPLSAEHLGRELAFRYQVGSTPGFMCSFA